MTAEQAEAVMLALAPQVEWGDVVTKTYWRGKRGDARLRQCDADTANTIYSILQTEEDIDSPWRISFYGEAFFAADNALAEVREERYPTLANAKAACERHYATGQW